MKTLVLVNVPTLKAFECILAVLPIMIAPFGNNGPLEIRAVPLRYINVSTLRITEPSPFQADLPEHDHCIAKVCFAHNDDLGDRRNPYCCTLPGIRISIFKAIGLIMRHVIPLLRLSARTLCTAKLKWNDVQPLAAQATNNWACK